MQEKTCKICLKCLPATRDFFWKKRKSLTTYCKECGKKELKARYDKNRDRFLLEKREYSKKNKEIGRAHV